MDNLSSILIGVVTAINTLVPQANLPQALGVQSETAVLQASVDGTPLPRAGTRLSNSEELKRLEKIREDRKRVLEQLQERREQALRASQQRREEAKENIAKIRDENKRRAVETIDENLEKRNQYWVNYWNNLLTRLSEILAKVEARNAENGTPQSAEAIIKAKGAIASAQTMVTAQATKQYILNVDDEETLGSQVSVTTQQFKKDLRMTQESLKNARQAVLSAIQSLRPSATPTSQEDSQI